MNKNYLNNIFKMRFFITHMVKWDMKYKFRRSKLGIVWTILQPLLLTLMIAFVFGTIFGIPMSEYIPYILSGFLVWDVLQSSVVTNSFAFIKAESYIRQISCPIVIYPIRESMVSICTFLVALTSLVVWITINSPQNIGVAIFSLPFTVVFLFFLSLPISIISAHVHVRYRDYPYIMTLLMQFLWYLSPVFFQESMFTSNELLHTVFIYNPVTSILALIRDPFLYGRLPDLFTYFYVFTIILFFLIAALLVNNKREKTVIFFL